MTSSPNHQQIEEQLLRSLQATYRRFECKECSGDEYTKRLGEFNEFIAGGKLPHDFISSLTKTDITTRLPHKAY
jgi:hypothetical protein